MFGTAHIGELGSRENILKAKLEILEGMEKDSLLIINNDNDMLHSWYLENKDKRNIMTYGIEEKSDIMAKSIVLSDEGSKFQVEVDKKVYDIERLVGKIAYSNSNGRELIALKNSLKQLPEIKQILKQTNTSLLKELDESLETCEDLATLIESAIVDEPPISVKEGGLIKQGYNEEVD